MFRQQFWMRAMNHPTPKRTILFSNTSWISDFSFAARMRKALLVGNISTTDKYICKKTGKTKFKGNKNLKGTQLLGKWLAFFFYGVFISTQNSGHQRDPLNYKGYWKVKENSSKIMASNVYRACAALGYIHGSFAGTCCKWGQWQSGKCVIQSQTIPGASTGKVVAFQVPSLLP